MGNNPSNDGASIKDHIRNVYSTAERKANQVKIWYNEERFRDSSEKSPQLVSNHMVKSIQLLIDGRTIGSAGVSKILCVITPLKFINKIKPSLALMASMVLTNIELLKNDNLKDLEACTALKSLIDKLIKLVRFGKPLQKVLEKIGNETQKQLAKIGRGFEAEPNSISVETLTLWADWALLHLIILFVTYFEMGPKFCYEMENVIQVVQKYHEDFQQLSMILKLNSATIFFKFYFRENSYFTYPVEGQKRWWLEAKIKLGQSHNHEKNLKNKILF